MFVGSRKGEVLLLVGKRISQPWKLKLTGHTIEAVVGGEVSTDAVTRAIRPVRFGPIDPTKTISEDNIPEGHNE